MTRVADSIFFPKSTKPITQVDLLSLLTVIPPKKISEFVDFHLRQHVEALPSFVKDTTDYLQKLA
jgi:hypothetical protein